MLFKGDINDKISNVAKYNIKKGTESKKWRKWRKIKLIIIQLNKIKMKIRHVFPEKQIQLKFVKKKII